MTRAFSAALLLCLVARAAPAAALFDDDLAERRADAKRLAGKAEAVVPLLGILDLWDRVSDRKAIGAALDEVAADERQRAEVRARATYLRSLVADRDGDRARAAELRRSIGLVTSWNVIGPFDNEGRGGYAQAFPPELELAAPSLGLDRKKEYPGKERGVSWRALPERVTVQGVVALDAALRPEQNVVGYATTWIKVERAAPAAVRVGSSGAIKVWVNERQVLARDVYRPVRIDQDAAAAWLGAGWNRITVKLGAAEGAWAFFLRITAPDGKPIALVVEPGHEGGISGGRSRAGAATVAGLAADLKKAAEGGTNAAAMSSYGLYLHYVAPDDPEARAAERALRRAVELAPSTSGYRWLAQAAGDGNERRKALEEAVSPALAAKTPEKARGSFAFQRAWALTDLGEVYSRLHRDRRADELWREALTVDESFFPATLKRAELVANRGLPASAQALLDERVTRFVAAGQAAPLELIRTQAHLAERRGRHADAEALFEKLHAANADDLEAVRSLLSFARSRGEVDKALARLDDLERARPDLASVAHDRADLLDGVGRSDEAHRALGRGLADCPDDERLIERDGRLLHRLGREEEALARLHRAIELRPQNPDLRAYLRQIESQRRAGPSGERPGDDLARAWAVPVPPLIERAHKAGAATALARKTNSKDGRGDAARVLLDLAATRVHSNGLSETFSQRVLEVLDERGAREQGDFDIKYTPDTQSVEVRAAKVYKKSGEVVEAVSEADRDLSEPWYGLYYDVHAQVIEFSHLEPGDVIDVEYVVSDVGGRNLFADYFGELHFLQEELPRFESTFILITPRARAFYFNQPRLPGVSITDEVRGDERVYAVRAHEVPKVEPEPGMPGFTDVAAYVHVSTYKTWEEVANWYRGLVNEQLQPDETIRRAVADAVKGITDERTRIRRLYDLVVQKTRYVGLEFGIHGYKPYRVSQVYARKFGDCKDKASLLVVMLREAGIDATLVLARTRRGGDLDATPASLAPFDHAIAYVPKYDLYLDGTAEFSGSDELPAQDQDIPVLLVSDARAGGQGHLVRTPVLGSEKNRVERSSQVALDAAGNANVKLDVAVSGEVAHEWRSHYQSAGERVARFEKAENGAHPGAHVMKADFPSLENLEQRVTVRAELEIPSWARVRAGALEMPALGHEGELLRSYARLSERAHDLVLGFPWEQRERVVLAMPDGYAPKRLPEARKIEGPFGSFELSAVRQGREVVVTSSLHVTRHRVTRAEYPAFRRFCLDVDAAMAQALVLGRE